MKLPQRCLVVLPLALFAAGLLPTARAATLTQSFDVPITFTGPPSTQDTAFAVAAFDSNLGTLNSVNVDLNSSYGTSTLDWTIRNTGTTTVSGSDSYSEGESVSVRRADTGASISVVSGGSSTYSGFSLAPGQQTTVRAFGFGGGGSGSISSANRSYFSRAGGGDVDLLLRSTGANLSLADGLTLIDQTGEIDTNAYGSITYNYTSFITPPPGDARDIAISSSTRDALADSQVRFYRFDYAGGALTIDTLGSSLASKNDTNIALYNVTGKVVKKNDNISSSNKLSRLTFADGDLANGTYYLGVAGGGSFIFPFSSFADGFEASSFSPYTGTVQINLTGTPVPEPASLAAVAAAGLLLRRRRR